MQHTFALSTIEAKFMSLAEVVKVPIWLHCFLGHLGIEQVDYVVFCDSQSVIHLSKDEKFHERSSTLMFVISLFHFM